jgi:hypothetical protein
MESLMRRRAWWHGFAWGLRFHLWKLRMRDRWTLLRLRWVAPDPDDAVERQLVGWGVRAELLRRRRLQLVGDDENCVP